MSRLLALPLLLLVLLSGCSTLSGPGLQEADPSVAARAQISDWRLRGRVSLRHEGQGWHAGLDWEQHAGDFRLQLAGPLGQGAVRLSGSAGQVVLDDARGERFMADDAEALLLAITGWQLPVTGLRDWVRAVPVPGDPARIRADADGRVARIEQSGWIIDYQNFVAVQGMQWPTRIRMERDDLVLRLVIDEWALDVPEFSRP